MMKILNVLLLSCISYSCLPSSEEQIAALKEEVRLLKEQNTQLENRITEQAIPVNQANNEIEVQDVSEMFEENINASRAQERNEIQEQPHNREQEIQQIVRIRNQAEIQRRREARRNGRSENRNNYEPPEIDTEIKRECYISMIIIIIIILIIWGIVLINHHTCYPDDLFIKYFDNLLCNSQDPNCAAIFEKLNTGCSIIDNYKCPNSSSIKKTIFD